MNIGLVAHDAKKKLMQNLITNAYLQSIVAKNLCVKMKNLE